MIRPVRALVMAVTTIGVPALSVSAQDLQPLESDMAKAIGKLLAEKADKLEKPQVKIVADSDKSSGVHVPDRLGTLVVPQKDLKESEELAEKFKAERGAPLAYLFLYRLAPVLNGNAVDVAKLRSIKISDDDGTERTVYVLLLSVRQVAGDEFRLYGFGVDEKPLVDSRFSQEPDNGSGPVAVNIKDVNHQAQQGRMVITVFGKFTASFTVGHKDD